MILTILRPRAASGHSPDSPKGGPEKPDVGPEAEDDLALFCRRLHILSTRDMDGTVTVVFRSMLVEGRDQPVGSSQLARATHLNRVTIIHHLQRLEQLGVVEHTKRKYRLRASGLTEMVGRMREEMIQSMSEVEELAEHLDRHFMALHDALDAESPPVHTARIAPIQKGRAIRPKNPARHPPPKSR